jgi:maltokinase
VISADQLEKALTDFLPRQRWFGAHDRELQSVDIARFEVLKPAWPALLHVIADADLGDGSSARFQVLVGLRPAGEPADFLHGSEHATLGEFDTEEGPAYGYDALLDGELGLVLLAIVAPGEAAERVRPITSEQSNSSLVYDDRLILKVFRRLSDGPNLDVEMTGALSRAGFTQVAAPLDRWQQDGTDLAVIQAYLAGGTEGWALALTSLRTLLADSGVEASESGGDFSSEARRLGEVTADLHAALGQAFGTSPGDADEWADGMEVLLARTPLPRDVDVDACHRIFSRLRGLDDPGLRQRVHSDYHLGQVMRTDAGWFILDFEGEPARPVEERRQPSSPFKDVAGMLRSFHYSSAVALRQRDQSETDSDADARAADWEQRNRAAFLEGYLGNAVEGHVIRADLAWPAVLAAFELDKAIYEVAYEQAHRPDWVQIPLDAIHRILSEES